MQWFNERERAFVGVARESAAMRVRVNAAGLVSAAVAVVVAVGDIHALWARRIRSLVNRIRRTLNEAIALLTDSVEAR